jgi:peptide/nickel transport system permease protein
MMRRIPLSYLIRRLVLLIAVVWLAATVNFLLPRITAHDPILEYMLELSATATAEEAEDVDTMLDFYERWVGLNRPLWQQYLRYLGNMLRFDFGRSFRTRRPVTDVLLYALPYTLALLTFSTLFAFVMGSILGAWLGWQRDSGLLKAFVSVLMVLSSTPPFIVALILIYVFAFRLHLFPFRGSYSAMIAVDWTSAEFWLDVIHHATLPALTMILVTGGQWAMWMRALTISTIGEDYMVFAQAKGLKRWRQLIHYAMRNAMLPQLTYLAISLGTLVSGYTLVETMFSYPGIGHLLAEAILTNDYAMIQGCVFFLIVAIALATFTIDLLYPLLDPRIRYAQ